MHRSARRAPFGLTFTVLAVSVASFSLLQSMTVPTLPLLQEQLGVDQTTASWIITAQLLAAAVATPIVGRLGDAFGKNRVLVVTLLGLSLGSLVAALATSIEVLLLARVIQGVGGGVIPLAFGIARDEFPAHRRASAISIISSLLAAGFGVGIVIAGPITDLVGVHWLFVLPAVVSAVAALAAAIVIPLSPSRAAGGVSSLPALMLAGWLTSLLLAVSQAPTWGWLSWKVLGLLGLAALLTVAWVLSEQRAKAPVIDLAMMRLRPVWTTNLVALLVGFSMYSSFGYVPQLLQTPTSTGYGLGATVTQAGLVMLPGASMSFLMGLVATPLARRFSPKKLVIAACFVSGAGMAMTAAWHDALWHVSVGVAVTSLGIGIAFAMLANLIVAAVPPAQTGVATGMNANLRTVGGAIGSAVAASIITAQLMSDGYANESGYTVTFVVLAVVMVVAGFAALLVPTASEEEVERQQGASAESSVAAR